MYLYGMRLRPFSIGCQPMEGLRGPVEQGEFHSAGWDESYWDVLEYDRKLSQEEASAYDLEYLGER